MNVMPALGYASDRLSNRIVLSIHDHAMGTAVWVEAWMPTEHAP
jgi:hypothetical protein